MIAATLFSGIAAPEVAMPEWEWRWHAEIERFPSAVIAARHPRSVNLGDVTAHDFIDRALAFGQLDALVFGSPCQSYSVAGKRLGLDDPRGNLALCALGIVDRLRPTWFLFENVPGLFSSFSGGPGDLTDVEIERLRSEGLLTRAFVESSDFAAFLSGVHDIGYQCVWSVLDAQYRGLAQRRERVFAVGHSRDWRRAAAVLLEPESLCGDPPTRSEARQDVARSVAPSLTGSGRGVQRAGEPKGQDPLVIAPDVSPAMSARDFKGVSSDGDNDGLPLIVQVSNPLGANAGRNQIEQSYIAHTLKAEGADASEDGTGRGVPLIAFSMKGSGNDAGEIAPTLRAGAHDKSHANSGAPPAIAFDARQSDVIQYGDRSGPLDTDGHTIGVLSVAFRGREGGTTAELGGDVSTALRGAGGSASIASALVPRSGVRRLMPVECERLQGFPDHYTLIDYRGKPAADGPRYKAIGNSMAVTVVRWILQRIAWLDANVPEVAA